MEHGGFPADTENTDAYSYRLLVRTKPSAPQNASICSSGLGGSHLEKICRCHVAAEAWASRPNNSSVTAGQSNGCAPWHDGCAAKTDVCRGQGLGKTNSGNAESIKVTRKQDTNGLGREGDSYDFAWWDHVYNKAASNIVVAKDSDGSDDEGGGVVCKTVKELKREDIVTTKRPTGEAKAAVATPATLVSPLYRNFVSSATADNAVVAEADSKDFSVKWTDEQLLEACEGRRFGHRGGYKQTGKEKRLVTVEAKVEAGDKDDLSSSIDQEAVEHGESTKPKKKKSKKRTAEDQPADDEEQAPAAEESVKPKKKKKKKQPDASC